MKIDLTRQLSEGIRNNRNAEDFTGNVKTYPVRIDAESIEGYTILEQDPISLAVNRTGKSSVYIEGSVRLVLEIPCDRCLEMTRQEIAFELSREVDLEEPDDEAQAFIEEKSIDVDAFLYSDIVMNLPMKVLCKESCKGLCKVCGINLNKETCDCDTFVPDPRMAAIADAFNAFNNQVK